MKKKILFVITKSNWGGAQRYVYDLAINLKNDFEPVVALGGDGPLKTKLERRGVKVIPIPYLTRDMKFFKDFFVFLYLLKIFRKEKPAVVHLNSSKIGGLGSVAGRLMRVPKIVFTAHGWAFNEDRSKVSRLLIKIFVWFTILMSHKVITVSDSLKKQTTKCPLTRKKMVTIRNAVAMVDFESQNNARKILLSGKYLEKTWIGTIAELHPNKGLKYAIEAMDILIKGQKLKNIILVIIGEGQERDSLVKLIKDKKMTENIFLVGALDEAVKLLKAFDIFILPSTTEALGYTLLEAGLAGLPVIGSNVGGIPEIIDGQATGILTRPQDSKDLAKAIGFLLNDKKKMRTFGENLNKKVREDFNLNKMIKETIGVYEG